MEPSLPLAAAMIAGGLMRLGASAIQTGSAVTGWREGVLMLALHAACTTRLGHRGGVNRRRAARLTGRAFRLGSAPSGEVAEWSKAHAWNACMRETVSWVRIPPSPPRTRRGAPARLRP
jgi:hypothetical protein